MGGIELVVEALADVWIFLLKFVLLNPALVRGRRDETPKTQGTHTLIIETAARQNTMFPLIVHR